LRARGGGRRRGRLEGRLEPGRRGGHPRRRDRLPAGAARGPLLGGRRRGRGASAARPADHLHPLRVPRLRDARFLAPALEPRLRATALEDEGRLRQHALQPRDDQPLPHRLGRAAQHGPAHADGDARQRLCRGRHDHDGSGGAALRGAGRASRGSRDRHRDAGGAGHAVHGDAGATDKVVSRWVLGLLTVGGLGLRLVYVAQPLRHDETMMWLQFARRPFADALSHYELATNHLLYTLLLYVPTRTLGDAPWVLRLPALLAGVLLIPATYVMTARLYGRAAAPIAAALVAGSSLMVEYSANARGYGLMTLGFLLAVACASRLLGTRRLCGWLTWAVPVALGLYAVPLMALPVAALLAWIVLEAARAPDPRITHEAVRGVGVG